VPPASLLGGSMKKVCVFVDGENLRHSICELFEDFPSSEYLPKGADWGGLFDNLASRVSGAERVRAYWYVIQSIDFYPYRLPDVRTKPDTLERILRKHEPFNRDLKGLTGDARLEKMAGFARQLNQREVRFRRRFDGWQTVQDGIARYHRAVEFRRAGAIRYDLFCESLGTEKAVDVKLGVDLLDLKDIYDAAVIVSGDQDYVPAVETIKDYGKTTYNVAFRTRGGQLLPGGARRLNQVTDDHIELPYSILAEFLRIGKPKTELSATMTLSSPAADSRAMAVRPPAPSDNRPRH